MTASAPAISVVLPTYNQAPKLERCLHALASQTVAPEAYEVVVVDDGSTDDTEETVRRFGRSLKGGPRQDLALYYCFQGKRRGLARARNRGVRDSHGPIVAFTQPECVPAPDWLFRLLEAWRRSDETGRPVGAIGGLTAVMPAGELSLADDYIRLHGWRTAPKVIGGQVRYLLNTNASYRYEALLTVGGFDERFPDGGGEDVDLGRRIAEAGYELWFDPSALVFHPGGRSIRALIGDAYRYGRSAAFHEAVQGQLSKPEQALGESLLRLGLSPLRAALYRREVGLPLGKSVGMAIVDGLVAVAAASGRALEAIEQMDDDEDSGSSTATKAAAE